MSGATSAGGLATLLGGLGATQGGISTLGPVQGTTASGAPATLNPGVDIGSWAGLASGQTASHPWELPSSLLTNPQAQAAAFPAGTPTTTTGPSGLPEYATFTYTAEPGGKFQFDNEAAVQQEQKGSGLIGEILGTGGAILGGILAPFTFGASAVLGAALGGALGTFGGDLIGGESLGQSAIGGLESGALSGLTSFAGGEIGQALGLTTGPNQSILGNLLGLGNGNASLADAFAGAGASGNVDPAIVNAMIGTGDLQGVSMAIDPTAVAAAEAGSSAPLGANPTAQDITGLFSGAGSSANTAGVNDALSTFGISPAASTALGGEATPALSNVAYNPAPAAPAAISSGVEPTQGSTFSGAGNVSTTPTLQAPSASVVQSAEAGSAMPGTTVSGSSMANDLTSQLEFGTANGPAAGSGVTMTGDAGTGGLLGSLFGSNSTVGNLISNYGKYAIPLGALGYEALTGGKSITGEYPGLAGPLTSSAQALTAQGAAEAAQGQGLVNTLISGQLTPGLQAEMQQAENAALQTNESKFANMGLGSSSMEAETAALIPVQAQIEQAQIAQQLATTGLNEIGLGNSADSQANQIYSSLLSTQISQDNQLSASIASLASAAGGFGISSLLGKAIGSL